MIEISTRPATCNSTYRCKTNNAAIQHLRRRNRRIKDNCNNASRIDGQGDRTIYRADRQYSGNKQTGVVGGSQCNVSDGDWICPYAGKAACGHGVPFPAKVVMIPFVSTLRTLANPESQMYRVPAASTVRPEGVINEAWVARPPSPQVSVRLSTYTPVVRNYSLGSIRLNSAVSCGNSYRSNLERRIDVQVSILHRPLCWTCVAGKGGIVGPARRIRLSRVSEI